MTLLTSCWSTAFPFFSGINLIESVQQRWSCSFPDNTRRCFDSVSTSFDRYGRQMDVETRLCAYWVKTVFSSNDRFQKQNIPTMKFRRATGDVIERYKHLNFYDKSVVANRFVSQTRPSRRHGQELQRHCAEDGFKGVQSNSFYFRNINHGTTYHATW